MARLPDETAIQRVAPRSVDSVVVGSPDPIGGAASAFAAGVQRLGSGIGAVGETARAYAEQGAREQNDRESYDTEAKLITLQKEQRQALEDERSKLDGDPAGFADRRQKAFREAGESIFNSAPDRLKPLVRNRLLNLDGSLDAAARAAETGQRDKHFGKITSDSLDELRGEVGNDPSRYGEVRDRGVGLIRNAPITAELKRRLEEQWRSGAAVTAWQEAVKRDPEAARASLGFGVVPGLVDRIVGVESGGNATAKNPRSTATGAGQFTEGTWMAFIRETRPELAKDREDALALRNDPNLSREAVAWYARSNARELRKAGFADTPGNIYLAHFAGPAGAKKVLAADPDASAESVLGQDAVDANPFLKGKTAGWLRTWADKKMTGVSTAPTAAYAEDMSQDERNRYGAQADRAYWARDAETRRVQAEAQRITAEATREAARALQRDMSDDIASIQRTGQGLPEDKLSRERVAATLGEEGARVWEQDRARGLRVHEATRDIENQPNDVLDERVRALEPQPGVPGFEKDVEAQRQVERRVERIRKAREQDPAMSVEGLQAVRQARQQAQYDGEGEARAIRPESAQAILQARIAAQQEVGIVNPLAVTRAESRVIARQLRAIGEENPEALEAFMGSLRKTYGKYAEQVLNSTLQLQGVNKDLSNAAADVLATIGMGKAPTKDQTGRLKDAAQSANGDALMTGKPPLSADTPLTPAVTAIPGTMSGFDAPQGGEQGPATPRPLTRQKEVGATMDPADVRALAEGRISTFDFDVKYNAGDGASASSKIMDAIARMTGVDPRADEGFRRRNGVVPPQPAGSAPSVVPRSPGRALPDLTPPPEPDPGPER